MLSRVVGGVRARDLMLTGRTLSAEEALDWGLISRVVTHDRLIDTATEVLTQCCRTAPAARRAVKSALDAHLGLFDRIGMQASMEGPEALEGFRAFKEKRSPDWVHPQLQHDGRL